MKFLSMKKIINIVCGIFILVLFMENISFVYAQNISLEDMELNQMSNDYLYNDNISGLNLWDFVDELAMTKKFTNNEVDPVDSNQENPTLSGIDDQPEIEDNTGWNLSSWLRWATEEEAKEITQTIEYYGIIRIKDPNNTWKWITILDRNLWATNTWAGVTDDINSYWYYFQWWNNYGFSSDPNVTIVTGNTQVDTSEYWPENPYSSNVFIRWYGDWSSVRNNNLRWWSWDNKDDNGWWYPITNASDRKWPCPENYHVPSAWEWSKLLEFWANGYTWLLTLSTDSSTNLKYFSDKTTALNNFYSKLYIPVAGKLLYQNSNTENVGIQALLRSSSPKNSNNKIFVMFWADSDLRSNGTTDYRANAFPIRCFYDSYRLPVMITYDTNWWYWSDNSTQQKVITYTKDSDDSEYLWNIPLWTVKADNTCWENEDKKCIFAWWYTWTGDDATMWTWNISEDITLYAKWLDFDDKDISISGVNFTIMDRNLWSTSLWTGENTYGYYLIWWEKDILCPEWYHIPSTWEWLWIWKLFSSNFNWELIKNLLYLPFAGKVINNENVIDEGTGYYLAVNWNEMMYAKINNYEIDVKNLSDWEKVSVRCFKDYNTWTIKFDSKGWNEISDVVAVNWREHGKDLEIPVKDYSTFLWWYTTLDYQEWSKLEKNINYRNEEEILLYARWECEQWYQNNGDNCEKIHQTSGWGSWWGWKSSNSSVIPNDSEEPVEWETWNQVDFLNEDSKSDQSSPIVSLPKGENNYLIKDNKDYSQEFIDAYNFAYQNWITTKPSIKDAKMYSPITRIQLAKMLSNYAMNVLWKEPDLSKWTVKFSDVSNKLNKQYDNAVTLSYQLWIMWQNIKSNKFRPYDTVTRAEFATVLSRLLYSTEDWKWKVKYYEPHMTKLYNEWIINNVNPTLKEKRWYVMIVLLRNIE